MNQLSYIKDQVLHNKVPKELLMEINQIASQEGISRVALVGGAVRDGMINQLNKEAKVKLKDIDILIEGSASYLAKKIESRLGKKRVSSLQIHKSYDTAELKIDGIMIDLATSRSESYIKPGENPIISPTNIEKDLCRRDFTINAMAIDLSSQELIDLYKGKLSLVNKELDFIHSESVTEDPTRVIRGARYAAKLGFRLSQSSLKQVKSTLKKWPWNCEVKNLYSSSPAALSSRLKFEMEILLKQEEWKKSLKLLQEWGALILLDEYIQIDQTWQSRIEWAFKLNLEPLTALISISKNCVVLAERLNLNEEQKILLMKIIEFNKWLKEINSSNRGLCLSQLEWCRQIESNKWSSEVIALAISMQSENWQFMFEWWDKLRHIKSPISAKELIEKGWDPGPLIGIELARQREVNIDKAIKANKNSKGN